MDYEQKYKEALERMKSWVMGEHPECFSEAQKAAEFIFPELQESENEITRKSLIRFLKSPFVHNYITDEKVAPWLDWLEKQEEPEDKGEISDGYHTFNELYRYRMLYNAAFVNLLPKELVHKSKRHHDGEECFGGGWFIVMANLPTGQISNHYELKDWDLFQIPEKEIADEWDGHTPQEAAERLHKYLLEKQGEQSSDKIEPKFKVRDWLQYRDAEPFLVEEITEQGYCNGNSCLPFEWEDEIHLWTIQDAKDGDVVVDKSDGTIGIFQSIGHHPDGGSYNDPSYCFLHCRYDDGFFYADFEHGNTIVSDDLIPATKEQRNLLFAKMKEAGYEWDNEKKELKKIESKTLDAAKVIEWIERNASMFWESPCNPSRIVEQFKKDFGL